jgi:hypothetical protein
LALGSPWIGGLGIAAGYRLAMAEPSEEAVRWGVSALVPFVRAWRLPLNPEDLGEMAYAVLRHASSASASAEITESVERQSAEAGAEHQRMLAHMASAIGGFDFPGGELAPGLGNSRASAP